VSPAGFEAQSAELLAARPIGSTFWVRVQGQSMWPLLRSGDEVQAVRCGVDAVRPGDVAVVHRPGAPLVVHVVASTSPLRTEALLGAADPPEYQVIARAVTLRRGGVVLAWTRPAAAALRGLRLAYRLLRRPNAK
jgi:hypothetical protein